MNDEQIESKPDAFLHRKLHDVTRKSSEEL